MTHVMRFLLLLTAIALGALTTYAFFRPERPVLPDTPALVLQMREVTRLETLQVSLYKKVDFSPQPQASDSLWKDVISWASYSLRMPRGRAIVFADVNLGYDIQRIDASNLRSRGLAWTWCCRPWMSAWS